MRCRWRSGDAGQAPGFYSQPWLAFTMNCVGGDSKSDSCSRSYAPSSAMRCCAPTLAAAYSLTWNLSVTRAWNGWLPYSFLNLDFILLGFRVFEIARIPEFRLKLSADSPSLRSNDARFVTGVAPTALRSASVFHPDPGTFRRPQYIHPDEPVCSPGHREPSRQRVF
jgi:hypothetical protein